MTMPLIDFLEDHGLVGEANVRRIFSKAKLRDLVPIRKGLLERLNAERRSVEQFGDSLFNFFASASLRGDFSCNLSRCRLAHIGSVERFSSLYSDHTVLPIKLGAADEKLDHDMVLGSVLLLDRLRPLIDRRLIVPVSEGVCLCQRCAESRFGEQSEFRSLAGTIATQREHEVVVTYRGKLRNQHVFEINIRDTLFDGVCFIKKFEELPAWLGNANLRAHKVVPASAVNQTMIDVEIYGSRLFDCFVQNYYAEKMGCAYLSDSSAESELFEAAKNEDVAASRRALSVIATMSHKIPMFADFSTAGLVALRLEMPEAFRAYRAAIGEAISVQPELQNEGEARALQFYKDVLEPKVAALRNAEIAASKLQIRNVVTGAVPYAVAVTFGHLAGASHGLLETVGSIGLLNALAEPVKDRNKRMADIKKDSFYFLLEIERRSRLHNH